MSEEKDMYNLQKVQKRGMSGGSKYLCQTQPQMIQDDVLAGEGWVCHGGAGNAKTKTKTKNLARTLV